MHPPNAAEDYNRRMKEIVAARYGYPLNPAPEEMRQKIAVNKETHRIRFEDETESHVNIVIEPK